MEIPKFYIFIIAAVTLVLSWLLFYFVSPSWVQYSLNDTMGEIGESDPLRCLVYATITTLVIIFILFIYNETSYFINKKSIKR